jgi:nitroimidazol reductase NimA-like FMN-containing flavoprotein (pyridoxamine 5'-phosphate oxidase superfamily)
VTEVSGKLPASKIRIRRHPERGAYDATTIREIVDKGLICHLGYATASGPVVLPTLYGRDGDIVYFHGSPAAGMFRHADLSVDVCLAITLVDGFVLARSLFSHSMNYRSVVIFGKAEKVEDLDEQLLGLRAITEHLVPGRWDEARQPNPDEMRQTAVFRLSLKHASAKVRTGGPKDDPEDLSLDVWAGVVPVQTVTGDPIPAADIRTGFEASAAVSNLAGRSRT